MKPDDPTIQELHKQLSEIQSRVSYMRLEGADQNDIEHHLADFELQWQDRLVVEQRAETRGRAIEIENRVTDGDRAARGQASTRDNEIMRRMMGKDAPFAYWESAPSRPRPGDDHALAEQITRETEQAARETRMIYAAIGQALEQSLGDIAQGREPDFAGQLTEQLERERMEAREQEFLDLVNQRDRPRDL